VIALIAATAPLFGLRLLEQGRTIAAVRHSIEVKEQEVQQNIAYIGLVDSLQNQIAWYTRSLALTDTLASRYRAWSPLLASLTERTRRVNSLWFTGLSAEKEGVVLTGRSIYRDRIPAVARALEGAVVRKITRSHIRTKEVYDFDLEVRAFKSLLEDTLAAPPSPEEARRVSERLRREEGLDAWVYKRQEGAGTGE